MLQQVRIVGSGLIGTSIALALRAKGVAVELTDIDPAAADLANALVGASEVNSPELVILALPSSSIPQVIEGEYALNPNSTFMDIGSVKTEPIQHVQNSSLPLDQFVPTHPMAGREISGASAARADLFAGRSWVITANPQTRPSSLALANEVIELAGASAIGMEAGEHDRAVAAISHIPQIVASLLAQSLERLPSAWLELAGAGLRDTTRIAASDPDLWKEIIFSNRSEISQIARTLQSVLGELVDNLDNKESIADFIARGRVGRSRIPGKHGGRPREYTYLPIVIDDKPGQLAAIFNECAAVGVNVEDLTIEHSPGQLNALITLALSSSDAKTLSSHLRQIGWNVHPVLK